MSGARLVVRAALLLVLALAAAGCGIPTDSEPQPLADETSTTAVDPAPELGDPTATVYLVSEDQLVGTDRALEGEQDPLDVLRVLLLPTTEEEQAKGLQTLIPQSTTALDVTDEGEGIWAVDLSSEWANLADPAALYAYGQVVLTLTDLDGVDAVRFRIEGVDVDVAPTVNQEPSPVVEAADYATLRQE